MPLSEVRVLPRLSSRRPVSPAMCSSPASVTLVLTAGGPQPPAQAAAARRPAAGVKAPPAGWSGLFGGRHASCRATGVRATGWPPPAPGSPLGPISGDEQRGSIWCGGLGSRRGWVRVALLGGKSLQQSPRGANLGRWSRGGGPSGRPSGEDRVEESGAIAVRFANDFPCVGRSTVSQPRSPRRLLPVAALLLVAGGCGDRAGGRQEISGTVTLRGQPLDEGVIEFHLLDGSPGQLGTKSGEMINDGKYLVPKAQGLVPGKYRVVISSGERKGARLGAGNPGPKSIFSKERIPPDYNLKTKQVVEVKRGGPNKFDYTIP